MTCRSVKGRFVFECHPPPPTPSSRMSTPRFFFTFPVRPRFCSLTLLYTLPEGRNLSERSVAFTSLTLWQAGGPPAARIERKKEDPHRLAHTV